MNGVIKINIIQQCCNIICHENDYIHGLILSKILQNQILFLEMTILNSMYWLSLCDQDENNKSEQ